MSNINSLLYNNYSSKNDDIEVTVSTKFKEENLKIPIFEVSPNNIVKKSIIIYGETGTGKTQIIRDIMFNCSKNFPDGSVFCPTNKDHGDYTGYFPNLLIFEDFGLHEITAIYERQQIKSNRYRNANDKDKLRELYEIIKNNNTSKYFSSLETMCNKRKKEIESIISDGDRKMKRDRFNKYMDKKYIQFYKTCIKKYTSEVENFSQSQQQIYQDLYFNPNTIVIFDDTMEEIKTLIKIGNKENNQVIKNFFYKGRHLHITHIYTFQNEDKLDAGIKKNAFYSIFTTPDSAKGFFSKANMCKSTHDKKRVSACSDEIFGEGDKKYRVMVYARLEYKHPFKYFKAELHDDFKMCDNIVWVYCKMIEDENKI